MESNIKLKMI